MKQTFVISVEIEPEPKVQLQEQPYELLVMRQDGTVYTMRGDHCHDVKSTAGYVFQSDAVRVVRVMDIDGKLFLYLNKMLPSLSENYSSCFAKYG